MRIVFEEDGELKEIAIAKSVEDFDALALKLVPKNIEYSVVDDNADLSLEAVLSGVDFKEIARTNKLKELDTLAEFHEGKDVLVNAILVGADDKAVASITSALSTMGRKPNNSISFEDRSGNWQNANKAGLESMQDAIFSQKKAARANKKVHSLAIKALESIPDIESYPIDSGW